MKTDITIAEDRISAEEYIDFLKRSDLGSQYPKERFDQRIRRLVNSVPISLTARNADGKAVGILFALTDYSYWMFVTDLGVDREYTCLGIGSELMKTALRIAGGKQDIAVYTAVNRQAVPFYEKLGMKKADDVMVYSETDWTSWTVE